MVAAIVEVVVVVIPNTQANNHLTHNNINISININLTQELSILIISSNSLITLKTHTMQSNTMVKRLTTKRLTLTIKIHSSSSSSTQRRLKLTEKWLVLLSHTIIRLSNLRYRQHISLKPCLNHHSKKSTKLMSSNINNKLSTSLNNKLLTQIRLSLVFKPQLSCLNKQPYKIPMTLINMIMMPTIDSLNPSITPAKAKDIIIKQRSRSRHISNQKQQVDMISSMLSMMPMREGLRR